MNNLYISLYCIICVLDYLFFIFNKMYFQNLLALRDSKAQSRINKHLKVCKAANKSVIADAIDSENTAITIAGNI